MSAPQGYTTASAVAATPPTIVLTDSGAVTVSANNEVVENLRIVVDGEYAIYNSGYTGVTVRNCEVFHDNEHGIFFDNADNCVFEDVSVTHQGTTCPIVGSEQSNIAIINTDNPTGTRLRLRGGTNGVYILNGSSTTGAWTFIEGYNFRNIGDGPRGSLIQFNNHQGPTLTDFSVVNDDSISISYPGDCISLITADNSTIQRGLVDGNNSVSGVGMMFESCDTALVEDVDFLNMGNGAISNWPFGAGPACTGIVWTRVRSKDNVNTDRGRGFPSSGALTFAATPGNGQTTVNNCLYYNEANPGNTWWETAGFVSTAGMTEADFTANSPIVNDYDWE